MNIFVNPTNGKPRAGWRLLLQFVLFLLFVLIMMLAKGAFISSSLKIYEAFAMGIAGVGSVWTAAVLLDKRSPLEYGLGWNKIWKQELALGLGLGTLAMTVIFLIQWSAGWLSITGYGWERASSLPYYLWILSYLGAMVIIGFYEELIFRGYQILNMIEGFQSQTTSLRVASLLAILISSVIFGLLHAGNPNATLISTLNIVFAGVILAIPFLVTGRLAVSIGIHISWNFIQGGFYGFAVSGTSFRGSFIQIEQTGASYLTGGSFGPEAGLMGIMGMMLMVTLFGIYVYMKEEPIRIDSSFKNALSKSAKQDE